MNIKKFGMNLVFIVISGISLTIYAEESLVDMVKKNAETVKGVAQNSQATANIPGYSEKKKQEVEAHLSSIEVGIQVNQLKNEGVKLRNAEVEKNPDGVIANMVEASDLKRVKGFEGYSELEMFKRADKYVQDPVAQMSLITEQGCKEITNDKKRGFFRREKKSIITDEIEEIASCEVPMINFKCKKTLEVRCKKTSECDYGGVQENTAKIEGLQNDPNKVFKFVYGHLEIGIDAKNNNLFGTCATFDKNFVFNVENKDLVTTFKMVYASFDDYFQLKLNGHIFYVGPDGGSGVEVVTRRRRGFAGQGYDEKVVYNGYNDERIVLDVINVLDMRVIVSGNGKGFLKIKVKKKCCSKDDWQENWVEHCEQEG